MNAIRVLFISLLMLTAGWAKPTWAQVGSARAKSGLGAGVTSPGDISAPNVSGDWKRKDEKIPNVVGLWHDEAILKIVKAGLRIGDVREETSTSVADHHVISELPAAGTEVKERSKVDLVIARAPKVKVPDVVGLTLATARAALDKADLEVGRIEERSTTTVAPALIISQHPRAGTIVREDRRVRLVVSKRMSQDTVPSVIGATLVTATTEITNAGLIVGTVTMQSSDKVATGLIISESPTAGSSVAAKSAVNLVVSSGVAKVAVPGVVGLTQAAAATSITGAGLTVGTVTRQSSPTVAAGLVISESPPAGTRVVTGSAVNLVLSTDTVLVPNVVGFTQASATTSITGAGLKLGTVTTQTSTTVAPGLVLSESPAAGTTVTLASSVGLVVSSGGKSIPTAIGASVPAAASGLITTFYSASTTVAVGRSVPTLPDGSVPVLFAGDGVNNPMLLAVGSITGTLDSNTTAIGLVRMALGVVASQAPLTSDVLASAIQASPHYAQLLSDVNASLIVGQSPLDSATVPQDAIQVARDAIVTLNTNGVLASSNAKIKAAAAPIQISPPLPYYFINSSEPYNRLWLTDNQGAMTVNAMNQTFIAWQFDTTDQSGNPLSSKVVAEPLQSTTLEAFGYYGGSATTTPLAGASPQFTLTLSQTDPVKTQNVVSAVHQFWVFLAAAASGISPDDKQLKCLSAIISSTFSAQMTQVVAHPTAATALAYFKSILDPVAAYKLGSSCGNLPPLVSTLFGQTIGRAWQILNVIKVGFSDIGTAAETFYYWDFPSQSYLVCKTNGGVTSFPCVTLTISPTAPSVAMGATATLIATASNTSGFIPTPPNLLWKSSSESVATVDPASGVVTGVAVGSATISVTDPVSKATASASVTVTAPDPTAAWIGTWSGTFICPSSAPPNTAPWNMVISKISANVIEMNYGSPIYPTLSADGSTANAFYSDGVTPLLTFVLDENTITLTYNFSTPCQEGSSVTRQ